MRNTAKLGSALSALIAATMATAAQATIVSATITGGTLLAAGGSFEKLATSSPFSVGNDSFNQDKLYAFDEVQNFVLTADLAANLGLTNIAAGTRVNSHFVFLDPLPNRTLQATITFDTPVLSAMTLRKDLIASNFLGASNVTYLTPGSVGLEPGTDFITLGSPLANNLRLNFLTADTPGDHFRVLTLSARSPVPEPETWGLLIAGLGVCAAAMRRKRAPKIA